MKKLGFSFLVVIVGLVFTAFPLGAARAANETTTVQLKAQNGSGEDGTATIEAVGASDIKVTISLKNASTVAQPAHIHMGTCSNLNPTPAYPLNNVVNGKSETTLMISMADLGKQHFAINVHKSAADIATYVSCGDIEAMSMAGGSTSGDNMSGSNMSGSNMSGSTLPQSGNAGQPATLAALALLALALVGAGARLARKQV